MIFVNEDYNNYKYLVEASDNYVVLSNSSYVEGDWQNPDTIDVIYQYIKPSTLTIEGTQTYTTTKSFDRVEISNDFWDRGDSPTIFGYAVLVTFLALYIINILTKVVKRGGLLG